MGVGTLSSLQKTTHTSTVKTTPKRELTPKTCSFPRDLSHRVNMLMIMNTTVLTKTPMKLTQKA